MVRLKRLLCFIISAVMILSLGALNVFADDKYTSEVYVNFCGEKFDESGISCVLVDASVDKDGTYGFENIDGRNVIRLERENIMCDIDNNAKIAEGDRFRGAKRYRTFDVEVSYYDKTYGGFFLQYDSYDGDKYVFVQCLNTNTWKTARIKLYNARFAGGIKGVDFRIVTAGRDLMNFSHGCPSPVYIEGFKIKASDEYSGFNISAETNRAGNVFFDDEDVAFDMSFNNVDGLEYEDISVKYEVFKPEADDMYSCWTSGSEKIAYSNQTPLKSEIRTPEKNGLSYTDKIGFKDFSFGVYVLRVEMTGRHMGTPQRMVYITDFSYSRRGETNYHFGANTHYDSLKQGGVYKYNEKNLRDQIDLFKGSGFGIARSGVRWVDVQNSDGEFYMPPILTYAYEYLHSKGLEGLANLGVENNLGYGTPPRYHDLGLNRDAAVAFGKYALFVADNLMPYTKYFSMPNEYDMCEKGTTGLSGDGYDAPSDESYYEITKAAYTAIKHEYPDAWINTGEIAEDPKWQFGIGGDWEGMYTWDTRAYERGILNYADSISYHRYTTYGQSGPESQDVLGFIKYGKQQKDKYDSTKQFWVNEIGWPSMSYLVSPKDPEYKSISHRRTDYAGQARFYARTLAMHSDKKEVDRFIFYEFQDDDDDPFSWEENFGLIHCLEYRTPWAAKPSYIAVAAFNNLVGEAEKSECLGYMVDYDYNDRKKCSPMVYKLTNKKNEEVWCVWRDDSAPQASYTVETGKAYANVYDLYGNLVKTVVGGTVTVNAQPEMQYVKGVDSPKGDLKVTRNDDRFESVWMTTDKDKISVRFTQFPNFEKGGKATVICAGYVDGVLQSIETVNEKYSGMPIDCEFDSSKLSGCNNVKFFVYDGLQKIVPLAAMKDIPNFYENTEISIERCGDICTITGVAPTVEYSEPIIITVYEEDTQNTIGFEEYSEKCLYQDIAQTDEKGEYKITFNLPENVTGAGVLITAKDFKSETVIY